MRRTLPLCGLAAGSTLLGCEAFLGADFDVAPGSSGGAAGADAAPEAATGASAGASADASTEQPASDASSDAGLEADACVPASCYDGPTGTAGIGICKAGVKPCDDAATCQGQVTPAFEDPETSADESCDGLTGNPIWSVQLGSAQTQYATDVALDAGGKLYVVGGFYGAFSVGASTLTSQGGADLYVAKLDSTGVPLWAKSFGSSLGDVADTVATDAQGNVYVAGEIQGAVDFGDGLHSPGSQKYDVFLLKLAPDGALLWSRSWGDPTLSEWIYAAAVDASGNSLVTGRLLGTMKLGNLPPLEAQPGDPNDLFVAKVAPDGTPLWARAIQGAGSQIGVGVAADDGGRVIVSGSTEVAIPVDGVEVGGSGTTAFVLVLDPSGEAVWSRVLGSLTTDSLYEVGKPAVDSAGRILVSTTYVGTTNLDGTVHNSTNGSEDVLVAAFDASGQHAFSRSFGGPGDEDNAVDLAVDAFDRVVIAGNVEAPIDCGGGPLAHAGADDGFLIKLSKSGVPLWCRTFGSSANDAIGGIAIDAQSRIAVSGSFAGALLLASTHVSAGASDALVAVFEP